MSRYGWPPIVAVPDVGFTNPRIMRSVVVLPAPLGPRKPVTEPGSTVKLSRSTARMLPRKTFVRSWATMRPSACGAAVVTGPSQHTGSSVRSAPDELQTTPGVVDRRHLHVHQPGGQPVFAHLRFAEIGRDAAGSLRPAGP